MTQRMSFIKTSGFHSKCNPPRHPSPAYPSTGGAGTTAMSGYSLLCRRLGSTALTNSRCMSPSLRLSYSTLAPAGFRKASSVHQSRKFNTNFAGWRPIFLFVTANRMEVMKVDSPYCFLQSFSYGRLADTRYRSEDEDSEYEVDSAHSMNGSTLDNFEEWRSKLTRFLGRKDEQEIVSREKKDRRDFEQLQALASRMGLHSRQYERVVVFSKVPLPHYRPDLDDKRPLREVSLPFGLQKRVNGHLDAYISMKSKTRGGFSEQSVSRFPNNKNITNNGCLSEHINSSNAFLEKILMRKSLQLRSKQQEWQNSHDGQQMLEFRKSLPAFKAKDMLLKTISENQVIVVSGETGCGKTTQLPQYILESEVEAARGASCGIICTQPRRISAMSVSERVATERGEQLGESVGYKVRLEGIKGKDTCLLFCTTGVLLRRLIVDRKLKGITHVIVDEIHERGMNEDFLLIVLKDLLPHRPDLRVILMSATMNANLFSSYFGGAPVIHIPGFTYPVRSHFLENVLEMTAHRLTEYNQIDDYGQDKAWKMQKQVHYRRKKSQIASAVEDALDAADFRGYNRRTQESLSCWNPDSIGFNLIENVLCHIVKKERPGAVLVFMTGWDDINSLKDQLQAHPVLGDPNKTLLLTCHSSMPSSEQRLIFNEVETGVRKIVLATNMAETSITINDVVFVVDCGKAKETSYDALNNTPCLLPSWISKAAARQRRGRAGRVQPGECYHLYPRCVYDAFSDYQLPELLRAPLQSLCLQIKSLQLGDISHFLSRALEPPEPLSVQNAVEYLKVIGALDTNEDLTILGKHLSMLPVEPKLGKMLLLGGILNCLDPIMTVVAGLSVRDPFLMPLEKKHLAESAKALFAANDYSDHLTLVSAYNGWREAESQDCGYEYCWKNFLSPQALRAIHSLRKQFFKLLTDTGLVDKQNEDSSTCSNDKNLVRAVICAGLFPGISSVVNKEKSIALKTMEDGSVLLYSNSVNGEVSRIPYPWLTFNEKVKVNTVFLRDSTGVSDSILLLFGGCLSQGGLDGHLKMMGGYLEFFMKPAVANMYLLLKRELDEMIHNKLAEPSLNMQSFQELMMAARLLISEDNCEGRFVYGLPIAVKNVSLKKADSGCENSKNELQTLLTRAGHGLPIYKTKELKHNQFLSTVFFNGQSFSGETCSTKKLAEKTAAFEALRWLKGGPNGYIDSSLMDNVYNQHDVGVRGGGDNSKNELQTVLSKAGHEPPTYKTKEWKNNQFISTVIFAGMSFAGEPCSSKKLAEKNAAAQALQWLNGGNDLSSDYSMNTFSVCDRVPSKHRDFRDAEKRSLLYASKWA